MGLFDKLKNKVFGGVSDGIGDAVRNTAERKTTEVVQGQVDKAADALIKTGGSANSGGTPSDPVDLNGANAAVAQAGGLAGLAGMMNNFATEAAKNLKICPACNEAASADKKFCPACGAKLPEQTMAAGAVCKACGKQNTVGEKFCSDCGAKLPFAEQAEEAARARDGTVMEKWRTLLPQFPRWNGGGREFSLEENGSDASGNSFYCFAASGVAVSGLTDYRALLKQNGFRPAGEYPSEDRLYKRTDGVVYYFESAEPFCSDPGLLSVSFGTGEPSGGFDYVKPEKKESKGFFGLFKK